MPIDYQQIHQRIQEIGLGARERTKTLEERRALARDLFQSFHAELDALRRKVDSARQADPNLRCASPLAEPLASSHPLPAEAVDATLIAADGSQILPDRHAALQYYVINVGAIAIQVGSGRTPQVFTETGLHMLDEFDDTFFSDSQVALQRDVAERKKLLEIAEGRSGSVIALTEGQLELWGATDPENAREFEKNLQDYLDALKALEKRGVTTAGYVDKPGANWVTKMLELVTIGDAELKNHRRIRPLLGVTDRWLFERTLGRYERSAVFALQSRAAEKYSGSLSIHFFYLNVGDEKHPKIARVDVPLWVAQDAAALGSLHAALIEQSKLMSHAPFPYILHRAHEIAVVTHQEKEQIDQMLALSIRNNGGEVGEVSGKQSAKNLPGRTRM
jgi:hypothetical protein